MKTNLGVVVLYENPSTREEAVQFCNQLIARFWSNCEFDLNWRSFSELDDLQAAGDAATKVAKANLIVFAIAPGRDVPAETKTLVETWLAQRTDHEGALVGLNDPGALPGVVSNDTFVYLRNLARCAGMDYLTEVPQELIRGIPDSLDSYSNRAGQVTDVLSSILRKPMTPSRLTS